MMLEAPPIDESTLQNWLDATGDPERFGRRPRTQAKFRAEPWYVTHWAWLVAGAAFVVYVIVGLWLLYGANYAIGDAIARASSARSIAHSRDPHLMAVGFYWMPLPAFAQVPTMFFLSRLGMPGLAMVLPTAFATAMTIPILARIGRDLEVGNRLLAPLVVLFACNPYTVFFAGNGMSEAWQVLALTGCFAAYLRWTSGRRTRDIARLGLWLSIAQLTRTESLLVVLLFGVLVAWQSEKGRRAATAVTVMAPAFFALFAWTVTAFVIIKHGWWAPVDDGAQPGLIKGAFISDQRTLATVSAYSLKLTLLFAPGIAIVIAIAGFGRELVGVVFAEPANRLKLRAVAVVGIGAVFPALQAYLLLGYRTFGDPRYFMPAIVLGTILAIIALERSSAVTGRAVVLLGCSIASAVSTFGVLNSPSISHVTNEPVVIDALLGRTPRSTLPDLDDWRAFTHEVDRRLKPGDVLVLDTRVAPAVFLFTDHPTMIATERDKDTERELQLPRPEYTWAIFAPPGTVGVVNPAIGSMIRGPVTNGKRWVKVALAGDSDVSFAGLPELWHLVDDKPAPAATASTTGSPTATATSGSAPQGSVDQENDN